MPLLDILVYPAPELKRKSLPVEELDEDLERLLDGMAETLRDADGVGLAAPQVGRNIRALIVDVPLPESDEREFYELINPEIVSSRGFQVGRGRLSQRARIFCECKKKKPCSRILPSTEKESVSRLMRTECCQGCSSMKLIILMVYCFLTG